MSEDPKKLQEAKKLLSELNSLRRQLNKEPIRLTDEETVKQLKSLPKDIQAAEAALKELEGSAATLYDRLRGVTSELKGQETATQGIRGAFRSLTKDAEALRMDEEGISELNKKQLENMYQRAKENKDRIDSASKEIIAHNDIAKIISDQVADFKEMGANQEEINELVQGHLASTQAITPEQKAILASYYDQSSVVNDLVKKTKERLDFENKIEKKAAGFTTLSNIVKSIPGLSGLSGPFEKAADAAKDTARETNSGLKAFAAGGASLVKSFGPITAIISAFKFFKDIAFAVDSKQVSIAKSMSLSASESTAVYKQFKNIKKDTDDVFVTTKNLVKAQGDLSAAFGATRGFTKQQLQDQVKLVDKMGLEADTAKGLQQLAMSRGESADDSVKSIVSATQALKMQTGIQLDQKAVLDEVAKTDGQLAANYKNNPGLIAKAVTQVRKLGLSLSQANKMSSSLLDFESSLAAEMEAEVMLGRDLNLNKARELALAGDAAGAAAEMRKQVGSLNDFQNLSVLQQNALAKAVGMTSDELANSLRQEENLQKLGANTKKQVEERVKQLRAEGKVAEANRLLNAAANEEDAIAALERVGVQQEFQQAIEVAKETFAEIFDENFNIAETARSIASVFSSLGQNLKLIKGVFIGISSIMAGLVARSIAVAIANIFAGQGKIPIAGLVGAAAGVATMLGLIAANKGDDVISPATSGGGYGDRTLFGPEGAISFNNKDTIVAGTNLGGNQQTTVNTSSQNALMEKIDKLIAVVEQGGHVYLDGSKVGSTLALSAKLSN